MRFIHSQTQTLWHRLVVGVVLSCAGAASRREEGLPSVLRDVTGHLERFNGLYINKLERELSSTSSRLSAIESTLRAVADRALAWDNIQNHMTVWTDQSRTMEKKLDMLNRCHEKQILWTSKLAAVDALNHKLTALDKKINTMTRLEFKVEKVSERIEEIHSKINLLHGERLASNSESQGFTQLAKRGLVSYLSNVEEKLDNISKKMERSTQAFPSFKQTKVYGSRSRSSWQVHPEPGITNSRKDDGITQCYLPPHNSRMLEDVSAKVDLLFDKITDPDYDYNTFVGHLKRQAPSHHAPESSDFETLPEHIFARFWKSLFSPFKKLNRKFRTFESQLDEIQKSCNGSGGGSPSSPNFGDIISKRLEPLDAALREEMAETRIAVSDQSTHLEKMAQMMSNSAYMHEQLQAEVSHQFQAQRAVMQSRFQEIRNLVLQYCPRESGPIPPSPSPTTVTYPPTLLPPTRTIRTKRPAQPRAPAIVRSPRCLPKDSPLWQVSSFARTLPVCLDGTRNSHRFSYRIHNSRLKSATSKRNLRNVPKKTFLRHFKSRSKREISLRSKLGRDNLAPLGSPSKISLDLDCSELYDGSSMSGIYKLGNKRELNDGGKDYYTRYCDQETDGGGWTVIQRRGRFGPPHENFTRSWEEYKKGFGNLEREFWWGNEFIQRMTNEEEMTLRFDLWDFDGNYAFAEYLSFKIASEEKSYQLQVSGYRGNASDSFSAHNGYLFSTYDVDNDEAPECCPCAPAYGGGWWFYSCFESNLNGEYHQNPNDNDYYRGLIWELWLGDYSLKATEMKIRPLSFSTSSFPTPFPGPFDGNDTMSKLPR